MAGDQPGAASGASGPPGVVLDTNAVLDAWVFLNPSMAPLLQALAQGQVQWLACPAMREELVHTLRLPQLQTWQPDDAAVLGHFDRWACLAPDPPGTSLRALWCSDNDDQVFIDLALQHKARWLVTQDRALLRLARKARLHGVEVVPPARWRMPDGVADSAAARA